MSAFKVSGEDIDRIFFTNQELIDNFTGVSMYVWGEGGAQIVSGWYYAKSVPFKATGVNTNWKQITSGSSHGGGTKTDGTAWAWGVNFDGQVPDGTQDNDRLSPVTFAGGGTNWRYVATGDYHTIGLKTDGTLWSGGQDFSGQLGVGPTAGVVTSPTSVMGGISDWVYVVAGRQHSAAIRSTGELYTWGGNNVGQLGNGDTSFRWSPTTVSGQGTTWKNVNIGWTATMAVKTDGTLWCWGLNDKGQLGTGDITNRSSPVTTAGGGTNWKVAVGGYRFAVGIKTDGTLWTWGDNTLGELGSGDATLRSSPVTVAGGGTTWKQAACGYSHTVAIKTDGKAWAWGRNQKGQLGDNSITNRSSPVTVVTTMTWKQVAAGAYHSSGLAEF